MSHFTALFDANVLYPAPLRDLLLQLAVADIFTAKWTDDIHAEWIEALLASGKGYNRDDLERTRNLMNLATRDCLVTGYDALTPTLELPDPDDRHVLAAAIVGRCDVIVTQNLKDFPDKMLAPYGLEAIHPDEFLTNHLALFPGLFCSAVRKVRARLKAPAYTADEYLATLTRQGLVGTSADLKQFRNAI